MSKIKRNPDGTVELVAPDFGEIAAKLAEHHERMQTDAVYIAKQAAMTEAEKLDVILGEFNGGDDA